MGKLKFDSSVRKLLLSGFFTKSHLRLICWQLQFPTPLSLSQTLTSDVEECLLETLVFGNRGMRCRGEQIRRDAEEISPTERLVCCPNQIIFQFQLNYKFVTAVTSTFCLFAIDGSNNGGPRWLTAYEASWIHQRGTEMM
nr:hypothetical protein Iba_chr10bCG11410 [Ipomoea batatas]